MPESWVQYNKELPYIKGREPWEVPACYPRKTGPNQYEVVKGRRLSRMLLVNRLRADIDKWREDGYPGATETSKELLSYWFEQSHPLYSAVNLSISTSASARPLKQLSISLKLRNTLMLRL